MDPTDLPQESDETAADALRVLVAAVAAQQAQLDEREARLNEREAALPDQIRRELRRQHAEFAEEQVRFNTQREVESRMLADGLDTLERDRSLWRRRRDQERSALAIRRRKVEEAERSFAEARQLLAAEKESWEVQRRALEAELHGLNNRIVHQRQKVRANADDTWLPEAPTVPDADERAQTLERLVGELSDQRALLVEQWQRLARVRQEWLDEHTSAAAELEAIAMRLDDRQERRAA